MNALTEIPAEAHEIQMIRPPELVLAEAKKAADALQQILIGKKNPVKFGEEQYIEFEDWQVLGRFYGYTAKVISTTPVEFGGPRGFEARAVVIDIRTGIEVSAADSMCLNDEDKWSSRPKYEWHYVLADGTTQLDDPDSGNIIWVDNPAKPGKKLPKKVRLLVGDVAVPMFQLRSMAQTRACAKALRNVLAWVVVLAGYKPTPAEEMTGYEPVTAKAAEHEPAPTIQQPQAKTETPPPPAASGLRRMAAGFDSICPVCNSKIVKGEMIIYDAAAKKATHEACA